MDDIKPFVNTSPQETAIAPNLTVFENLPLLPKYTAIKHKRQKSKLKL